MSLRCTTFILLWTAAGCGGRVEVDEVDVGSPLPVPTVAIEDECAQYDNPTDCCANHCRKLSLEPGTLRCLSADFDCSLNPDRCVPPETCVAIVTSGNGGCDFQMSVDTVGACIAP